MLNGETSITGKHREKIVNNYIVARELVSGPKQLLIIYSDKKFLQFLMVRKRRSHYIQKTSLTVSLQSNIHPNPAVFANVLRLCNVLAITFGDLRPRKGRKCLRKSTSL